MSFGPPYWPRAAPASTFGLPHSAIRIPQSNDHKEIISHGWNTDGKERGLVELAPPNYRPSAGPVGRGSRRAPASAPSAFRVPHSAFRIRMASPSALCNQKLDPGRCVSITASNASTYQMSHSDIFD